MAFEIAQAVVPIRPELSGFEASVTRGVESSISRQIGAAQRLGAGLTAAVTAPVVGIGIAAARSFGSFDDALTQSIAIMGDAGDALRDDLAAAAREVATQTTFSAAQAAESFFFLASAGLDAEQSIAALPSVAAFAQAGMFDLATATDLATDAQSALGLTIRDDAIANMENLTRVTDVLVAANTLANASVEQFSVALTNRAGAALRLVNKDVEEGVAVLAAFADQGIKGAEAGTRLDIVLRDLQSKALTNKAAFDEFNISVFNSEGNVRNIADILADLEGAFEGANDETQRATLLQLGFSDRSVASLLALIGLSDQIRTYEAELRDAGGTTEEVANRQLTSFNAQMSLAASRISDAGLTLGESFAPLILASANAVATLVEGFASLPGPIRNAIGITTAFLAAAGPLLLIGGRVAQSVLAIRTLATANIAAASSASTLAAAEARAAASITAAGAAARTAAVSTQALAASGVGSGLAASGGIFSSSGAARGVGALFGAELVGGLIQAIGTQETSIGDTIKDTAANAVRGAGLGAAIGSAVPVIGTGIGAAAGGIIGGAVGFFRSSGGAAELGEEVADTTLDFVELAFRNRSEREQQLLGEIITNTVNAGVTAASNAGLSTTVIADFADTLEQQLLRAVALGFDPADFATILDDATLSAILAAPDPSQALIEAFRGRFTDLGSRVGQRITGGGARRNTFQGALQGAVSDAFSQAVSAGITEGIDEAGDDIAPATDRLGEVIAGSVRIDLDEGILAPIGRIDPTRAFGTAFIRARQAGESIIDAVNTGLREGDLDLTRVADSLTAGLDNVPSIFQDAFADIEAVSISEIEDLVSSQAATYSQFETNLRTITEAGLLGIIEQLEEGGPQAVAAAEAIAADLTEGGDAPFRIEAALRGIAEDDVEAFLSAFQDADARTRAEGFAAAFVGGFDAIDFASKATQFGVDFVLGLQGGFISQFNTLLSIARSKADELVTTTRNGLEIRSPSRVGFDIGASFVEGIQLGIDETRLTGIDSPQVDFINAPQTQGGNIRIDNLTIQPTGQPTEADIVKGLETARTIGIIRAGGRI